MTKTELLNRLSDIEYDDFEVKEARSDLPKNIWETVSAFSNASGGWIVLGVSKKGKKYDILGVDNAEKQEHDFTTVLCSRSKFNVLINPVENTVLMEKQFWLFSFHLPGKSRYITDRW